MKETQVRSSSTAVVTSLVNAVSTCQPKLSSSGLVPGPESEATETRIEPSLRSKGRACRRWGGALEHQRARLADGHPQVLDVVEGEVQPGGEPGGGHAQHGDVGALGRKPQLDVRAVAHVVSSKVAEFGSDVAGACGDPPLHSSAAGEQMGRFAKLAPDGRRPPHRGCGGQSGPCGATGVQAFLVSQKISAISSILASSSSALAASSSPLVPVAPASLVASLTSWCSWGYFSKCGGLK